MILFDLIATLLNNREQPSCLQRASQRSARGHLAVEFRASVTNSLSRQLSEQACLAAKPDASLGGSAKRSFNRRKSDPASPPIPSFLSMPSRRSHLRTTSSNARSESSPSATVATAGPTGSLRRNGLGRGAARWTGCSFGVGNRPQHSGGARGCDTCNTPSGRDPPGWRFGNVLAPGAARISDIEKTG